METFEATSATFSGRVQVGADAEEAFLLFSPVGETLWVPGWNPRLVHPAGADWEEGMIFLTREELGDAVWVVTRLARSSRRVTYHRVEPGRYVARVEVTCRPLDERLSEASVAYTFVGLSEDGNREIAAMTQANYDAKMERWARWIHEHLAARKGPSPSSRT